jgi:protein SCO1/2
MEGGWTRWFVNREFRCVTVTASPAQTKWLARFISSGAGALRFVVLFPLCLGFTDAARAQSPNRLPAVLRGVGIDQKLNQQVPLDLNFRNEDGKTVQLANYFGLKPIVLSLVYYDCPMLCTTVENGLLESLKNLKFSVGREFDVITVSFDPRDQPRIAAAKKAIYAGLYGRRGASEGWHFLTGDEPSIHQLTQAVGFRYRYDPETRQYAHATAIMVLTPQGKLSRYLYGIQYPSADLRLSLVEASANKIGSPVDEFVLFCCQYNPVTGKYGLIIARVIQAGGLITILSLGSFIFAMSRGGRQARA